MLSVKLIDKVRASKNIFYLKLEKPLAFIFTPGQFARLGIKTSGRENEKIICWAGFCIWEKQRRKY